MADVVPEERSEVWGMVYELLPGHLERLDRDEGYPEAYTRFQAEIAVQQRSVLDVWVYSVSEKRGFVAPSRAYLGLLTTAARQYNFPEPYVLELEQTPTSD